MGWKYLKSMKVSFEVKGVTQNSQYVTILKTVILTNYQIAKNI